MLRKRNYLNEVKAVKGWGNFGPSRSIRHILLFHLAQVADFTLENIPAILFKRKVEKTIRDVDDSVQISGYGNNRNGEKVSFSCDFSVKKSMSIVDIFGNKKGEVVVNKQLKVGTDRDTYTLASKAAAILKSALW